MIKQGGHEVQILDLIEVKDTLDTLTKVIHGFEPGVIGISLRNIDNQSMHSPQVFIEEATRIIEEVRRLSPAPIVLGGAGYSIFPDVLLNHSSADMGICGEGEEVFNLLLKKLELKQPLVGIPGLYVKGKGSQERTFINDLDRLSLPGPDLLGLSAGSDTILPVQTRRGCPMKCSYCSTASIEGTLIRKRSPKKVVEWITKWTREGVRQFYFVDNTFNLPVSYAHDLCSELMRASLGVTWRSIIYPFKVDERLAAAMAEAGCVEASVGFESGCEKILQNMNKRFRLADITRTCNVLHASGIRRMGFLLLGGPGETRQTVEESLAFADSLDLDALKLSIGIRIYPHTHLADQARKEGIIGSEDNLLFPIFYIAAGLKDWIEETVRAYIETRPHCIADL